MKTTLRRILVRIFRWLPFWAQRRISRATTPNYTVGAVVLLRDPDERLLLVTQPGLKGWSLPGGHLKRGEAPQDGAAREVREETSISLGDGQLQPAVPNAIVLPATNQVDMVFTATVEADTAMRPDAAEVGELGWFAPDELPQTNMATARLLAHFGLGPFGSVEEANQAADKARAEPR